MKAYHEIPALHCIYLEDSYVMGVEERDGIVLDFGHASSVEWLERSGHVFTDPDGEQDLGNIDVLRWEGDHYDIAGDWGHVHVRSAEPPDVRYAPPEP
jgi:hypothetical protein